MGAIAVLGGTGPEGSGLALRFAQLGEEVVIGSRDADRAAEAAARIERSVAGARVHAAENGVAAAQAERVVLAFPHAGVAPFLATSAEQLAGKVVVDVVVPLRFENGVCVPVAVPEGSLGEMIQRMAPRARVVSAFKNIAAEHLHHLARPLEGDVLVCGDDDDAVEEVCRLATRIPNLRGIHAGRLAGARALEQLTVMQLNVNRRYHAVTSLRLLGI